MSSTFETMAEFAAVDRSNDPGFFVRTLELAKALPGIPESRLAIMEGLRMAEGHSVLDVGCGIGFDSLLFAERVGPTGSVTGIDLSAVMVAEAARRAEGVGLPVSYATGDVTKLEFPDGVFDICRAERVLEYVPEVDQALSEMIRVTRPGGRVGVFGVDCDTTFIDHPDPATTARVIRAFGAMFPNPDIGRTLIRRFSGAGLTDLDVRICGFRFTFDVLEMAFVAALLAGEQRGAFTRDELTIWWDDLRASEEAGHLCAGMSAFVVAGTKPPS